MSWSAALAACDIALVQTVPRGRACVAGRDMSGILSALRYTTITEGARGTPWARQHQHNALRVDRTRSQSLSGVAAHRLAPRAYAP